jgi:hypothetical protein
MKKGWLGGFVIAIAFAGGGASAQDPSPVVTGRVVSAEDGRPIAGAHVYGPGGLVRTGPNGEFAVPAKPESEDQMLLARADGYALHHEPFPAEGFRGDITIRLGAPRVVVVRLVGEDGRPVRGATVFGRLPTTPAYSALERLDFTAVTDQDGVAVITGIPADLPVLTEARPPGMIAGQTAMAFPIRPPAPADLLAAALTLTITAGRTLRIAVESGGRPVSGATVNLLPLVEPRLDFGGHANRDMSKGSIRTATTDANGAAAFDSLPANPITCEVRKTGLLTRLQVVEAAKSDSKPVKIRLMPDPSPPGRDVPWRTSVAVATDEAKRTSRPVFLVMTMDGEKANDWMAGHHYHDSEIVRAAREVVPLLSSAFGEGGVGAADGHVETGGVCTRYGTISCRAHQQVELLARAMMSAERDVFEVPRHIAATPEGERILHRVFYLSERDLLRLIVQSLRAVSRDAAVRLARDRLGATIEDAAGGDAAARKRACQALALLANSGDEHAVAVLQALPELGVPPAARSEIAAALRPSAFTSCAVTLRDLLRESDRDVRRALLARLGEVAGDEAAMDLLAAELRTSDVPAREVLLRALGVERKADELLVAAPASGNRWRIVEELIDLPDAGRVLGVDVILKEVGGEGRLRMLRALGRRAAGDASIQDLLMRTARGGGSGKVAALRALAAAAIGEKPPAQIIAAFADAAQSPDPLLREEALRCIAAAGIPVAPETLEASMTHPARAVRIRAAIALSRIGSRAGERVMLASLNDVEFGAEVKSVINR